MFELSTETVSKELLNIDEAALALAGSWEDQRSAQEIVMDIRQSRSTKRVHEGHVTPDFTKGREVGQID
jgi:hypothetical protein